MSAKRFWIRRIPIIAFFFALAVLFVVSYLMRASSRCRALWQQAPIAFDGPSDELKQTVIVPTLDTPIPEGKNVIWCASFQLAWNEMRDEIVGEPIRIANAEELAERFNNATASKDDLEPESYYVKAGAVADGVIEQIQQDMAARFPDAPTPEIDATGDAVVAYAYLAANVKFTIPFFENRARFRFRGKRVTSFGIREEDDYASHALREQVEVLYVDRANDGRWFVVDPCRSSEPYQVILACIEPGRTLAETVEDMQAKIATWDDAEDEWGLGETGALLVPNVFWRINHRFEELEGPDRRILNENCPMHGFCVAEASQLTEFKLNRSGAELKSEAKLLCPNGGAHFVFDKPFLIVMKKRGAERPFFVMWVDNAELLCKR